MRASVQILSNAVCSRTYVLISTENVLYSNYIHDSQVPNQQCFWQKKIRLLYKNANLFFFAIQKGGVL